MSATSNLSSSTRVPKIAYGEAKTLRSAPPCRLFSRKTSSLSHVGERCHARLVDDELYRQSDRRRVVVVHSFVWTYLTHDRYARASASADFAALGSSPDSIASSASFKEGPNCFVRSSASAAVTGPCQTAASSWAISETSTLATATCPVV